MTLASPRSSSVSWVASAASLVRSNPRASRSGFSSSKSHLARRARAEVAAWYALTTCDEVTIALAPGWPGTEMPYSVSVPMTRRTLMSESLVPGWRDCDAPRGTVLGEVVGVQRQFSQHVLREDVPGRLSIRPLDLDLDVEPSGPQDRRIDHVLAVRGTDDDHVLQALDAVDLTQQLRHDRVLDVAGHPGPAGPENR